MAVRDEVRIGGVECQRAESRHGAPSAARRHCDQQAERERQQHRHGSSKKQQRAGVHLVVVHELRGYLRLLRLAPRIRPVRQPRTGEQQRQRAQQLAQRRMFAIQPVIARPPVAESGGQVQRFIPGLRLQPRGSEHHRAHRRQQHGCGGPEQALSLWAVWRAWLQLHRRRAPSSVRARAGERTASR